MGCPGKFTQLFERDVLKRFLMGAFQHDMGCYTSLKGLEPAQRAQAPAVTGFQTRESVFRARCDQVVASRAREIKKSLRDFGANHMRASVFCAGVAATISEIPGERVVRARHQFAAENVQVGASHGCVGVMVEEAVL